MTPDPVSSQRVDSPCIKVCVLDAQSVCVGCGRTIDEIAQWSRMTPEQQRQASQRAAQRQSARGQ